jgi:hypothetical protein
MLIFEWILTTLKPSIVFKGTWESIENWLSPKIKPPSGNIACHGYRQTKRDDYFSVSFDKGTAKLENFRWGLSKWL